MSDMFNTPLTRRLIIKAFQFVMPNRFGPDWSLVRRRITKDADTGQVIQRLHCAHLATTSQLVGQLPKHVKNIVTDFVYKPDGCPWHSHAEPTWQPDVTREFPIRVTKSILQGLQDEMRHSGLLGAFEPGPVNQEPDICWDD